MELPRGKMSGKEFWLEHIKAAEAFQGSNKEYCLKNGLTLTSFNVQKNKFGFTRRKKTATLGFSEVRVSQAAVEKSRVLLPDPKWLAEFLKAWGTPS